MKQGQYVTGLWNGLGFRDRLLLFGFALTVLMLLAVAGGASTLVDRHLRVELQARAQQMTPLFNAALGAPMAQRDYASVAAIVDEIRGSRELVHVEVLDAAGRAITAQRASTPAQGAPSESADTLTFTAPLQLAGQPLGSVVFGLSGQAINQTRHSILVGIALLSAACLAVFSTAMALLGTAVTRPLVSLIAAARAIQAGRYEVELNTTRQDEFGVLMKTFSKMTQEIRRKVSELVHSESLQRSYLQQSTSALQEAQAAHRVKAEFIANMSHEIKTPMNSIMGYADLLRLTPLGPQQTAYVNRLQESGSAMLALINNLLDFSRIEAGQHSGATQSFSVRPLVDAACGPFMSALMEKGLVLHSNIEADVPDEVVGDRQRLHQVLVNLIGNAVKFTLQGQIDVEVRVLRSLVPTTEADPASVTLRMAVRDTGIGIAPEQLHQVFQPFSQADGSITRRFGGTGLGLSISHSLVELMGGRMEVHSTPGVGSEFAVVCTFTLPSAAQLPASETRDQPTTYRPASTPAQTADPVLAQALHAALKELDQALEGKMMRARQVAEEVAAHLQGTTWEAAFAPVLTDTRRLRFNQARDSLQAFAQSLHGR